MIIKKGIDKKYNIESTKKYGKKSNLKILELNRNIEEEPPTVEERRQKGCKNKRSSREV